MTQDQPPYILPGCARPYRKRWRRPRSPQHSFSLRRRPSKRPDRVRVLEQITAGTESTWGRSSVTTGKDQWKSESRLIVHSLVTALLISSVVYGERGLERVFDQWAWWLAPLGMTLVLSVGLWRVMRLGQQRLVTLRPVPEDQQPSTPTARRSFPLLQSKMDEVIQTLEGAAKGRQRRHALHAWPWYLL